MKSIGMYLAIFGAISIGLNFLGRELMLMSWADNWGSTVGWVIRIGMIVVGLAIMFLVPKSEEEGA